MYVDILLFCGYLASHTLKFHFANYLYDEFVNPLNMHPLKIITCMHTYVLMYVHAYNHACIVYYICTMCTYVHSTRIHACMICSCNTGTHNLRDMHVCTSLRPADESIQCQANHECVCYNCFVELSLIAFVMTLFTRMSSTGI